MRLKLIFILGMVCLFTSCNIFNWTSSSEGDDLFYEGVKLFNEKKFGEAKEKFAEAMKDDPNRSEYRYYHAKATLYESDINFLTVARDIIQPTEYKGSSNLFTLPLYSRPANLSTQEKLEEQQYKTRIYKIVSTCHDDIYPIFRAETYGTITREDILFSFSLFSLARSILQLRDTNNDGVIDEKDYYFFIYTTDDGNVQYDIVVPENLDREQIAEAVKNAVIFISDGATALVEIFMSDLIDTEELNQTMDELKNEMNQLLP
ncbi:hypothetical protein JXJ21_14740 [candidate division KSB1 bacterium]|nr:hypothetical protein [candidate division KSB1 bacterium]